MPSIDPTKPERKSLTFNRLPKELVEGIKTLAIKLDCTLEDLAVVVLQEAVRQGDKLYIPVQKLKAARKKEIEDRRKLRATILQLQPKLEALEAQNG